MNYVPIPPNSQNAIQILPLSPRNSYEAIKHLMESNKSKHLITDEATQSFLADLSEASFSNYVIRYESSPRASETEEISEAICWDALLPTVTDDDDLRSEAENICLLMHTSGSTG